MSRMTAPEISVVIPTLRRETRLAFALEALAQQTIGPERFEVVVVRVVGERGPFAVAPDRLTVRDLEAPAPSASGQRNVGWRTASAPLIAFTDDDCRPAPDWLERLLDALSRDAVIAQGKTEPDPDERQLLAPTAMSQEIDGASDWYEACNIAYPRRLLEELGGFDEAFTYGAEDTDLGLRARAAGAERVFVPAALVRHAVHARPLHRALLDAPPRPTVPLAFARHPVLRRNLYLRVFWNRRHAQLLLGLAGLALLGRRRGSVAMVPYLSSQLRYSAGSVRPTPRGLARFALSLAERLAIDLAGLLTSARRSARHKTLIL